MQSSHVVTASGDPVLFPTALNYKSSRWPHKRILLEQQLLFPWSRGWTLLVIQAKMWLVLSLIHNEMCATNPSSWANLSSRAKKNAPHAVLPFLHCIVWYVSQLYQHPQGLWITFLGIRACTFGGVPCHGAWAEGHRGSVDSEMRCGDVDRGIKVAARSDRLHVRPRDSRIANGEGSWGFIVYDHDRSCISDQEHSGTSPLPLRFGHIFSRAPAFWMWCTSRTLVVESRSSKTRQNHTWPTTLADMWCLKHVNILEQM